MTKAVDKNPIPELSLFKVGKVRSVYDMNDTLLLVASDRVSSFDVVLKEEIPQKGAVLTRLSKFWFNYLGVPHHLISTTVDDFPSEAIPFREKLEDRTMLVKKTKLIPVECIVRGYLSGSGWKEYQKSGTVCGIPLPEGLQESQKLPEPIFTPTTKPEVGKDMPISYEEMEEMIGKEKAAILKERSLEIYRKGADYAETKGIIIADTKFEFGEIDGGILLIDEVLTPDSSRFWPKDQYQVGVSPPSMDKQIVRNYLESTGWDKTGEPPELPEEILQETSEAYLEIERILTQ